MKLASGIAGAGIALMVAFAVPRAWGHTTDPGVTGEMDDCKPAAATSPTVPAERVAPGVPGIPANTQMLIASAPAIRQAYIIRAGLRGEENRRSRGAGHGRDCRQGAGSDG